MSIDCETLALGVNPAIISFGAQLFDRDSGKLGPSIYHEIDPRSAVKSGTIDGSTIVWWMNQGDTARRLFETDQKALQSKLPLATALHTLINFMSQECDHSVRVWSNGPAEDITWLNSAFERGSVGLAAPWLYKNVRDVRTIVDAAKARGWRREGVPSVGTTHHALDDAKYQANVVISAWHAVLHGCVEDEEL